MDQAFRAPPTPETERIRPNFVSHQARTAHAERPQAAEAQAIRPTYQQPSVSGAALSNALRLTDKQMQDNMSPMAKRGYLYLTRFSSAMAMVGAAGAAVGIVGGAAGLASGIGIPIGGLAAIGGAAVLLGGLALSALTGAAARSISRSSLRDNAVLRDKMDTLREMQKTFSRLPLLSPQEKSLLQDVEATLRRCDSSFASALVRTTKSAIKAPLAGIAGIALIGAAMTDSSGLGAPGGFGSSNHTPDWSLRGNEEFALSPAMERWTSVLGQTR